MRISKGVPRWWPEAREFPYIEQLTPPGWVYAVGKIDPERADRGYRAGLHRLGLDRVRALIEAAVGDDPRPPCLLCWDRPEDCHRGPTGFAGWWFHKTGEQVKELSLLQGLEGGVALVYEQSTPRSARRE